jgi:hypothetical protein
MSAKQQSQSVKKADVSTRGLAYVVPRSVSILLDRYFAAKKKCHVPIPMTVPYSGWASSAVTAGGQRQTMARKARKRMEKEERSLLECVLVGRLAENDIVVVQGT